MPERAWWIVECVDDRDSLDFTGRQPQDVFGTQAISGMSLDRLAQVIYTHAPTAMLRDSAVRDWPKAIDSRWIARVKLP